MGPASSLVILCGRSFSGKSTIAGILQRALGAQVVSLDDINRERGLAAGTDIPLEEWMTTHSTARARVTEALRHGRIVVVDDTSSPRFLRDGWRALSDDLGSAFALVYIEVAPEVAESRRKAARLSGNRHDVEDAVLQAHLESFEPPAFDEAAIHIPEKTGAQAVVGLVRTALRNAASPRG